MFGGLGGFSAQGPQGYGGYGADTSNEAAYGGAPAPSQGLAGYLRDSAPGESKEQAQGGAKAAAHTLMPVTIRMLLDGVAAKRQGGSMGPDENIRVNGKELNMLTLVACVDGIQMQQMGMNISLNDGTGKIDCHMYADTSSVSNGPDFQAGDYIRLFGHLRQWEGEDRITAHRAAKIEDANEIAYHAIEVVHVHLSLTGKLVKPPPGAGRATQPAASTQAPAARFPGPGQMSQMQAQPQQSMPQQLRQAPQFQNAPQQFQQMPQQQFQQQMPQQQFHQQYQQQQQPPMQQQQPPMQQQQSPMHQQQQQQQMQQQAMHQQQAMQQQQPPMHQQQQLHQQPTMQQQAMHQQQAMQQQQPPMHQQQPMQMGYGGVPGAPQAAATSPFQGNFAGSAASTGPPPGGACGSHYANNLYSNPPAFR